MGFEQTIREVREAFRILRDPNLCVFGCKIWIKEGASNYYACSPEKDGICQKCSKKRYKKEPDNESE